MKSAISKFIHVVIALIIPILSIAQPATPAVPALQVAVAANATSPYQDPVFYMLCFIALVLLVFILQLSKLFSAVVGNIVKKDNPIKQMLNTIVLVLATSFFSNTAQAGTPTLDFLHDGFGSPVINALAIIIAVEVAVVLYYVYLIRKFLVKEKVEAPYVERQGRPFWDRFNKSVALEKEAAILTDHNYDGIQELDNSLPPWWKYGFYLTIVFAVAYLFHYHVFATGPLMIEELEIAEQEAKAKMDEMRKTNASMVDETTVKYLAAEADLNSGKALFTEKTCVACHGQKGEGGTGPNLTDDYWIHGGTINEIFSTIKYGVPEKGMLAWANTVTPSQMAQIASYIKSLRGTNPPNPKEPQGILVSESSSDTTKVATVDSTLKSAIQPIDTLKK